MLLGALILVAFSAANRFTLRRKMLCRVFRRNRNGLLDSAKRLADHGPGALQGEPAVMVATIRSGQPAPVPNTLGRSGEYREVADRVIAGADQAERMLASPARRRPRAARTIRRWR